MSEAKTEEANVLFDMVQRRYGDRLTADQLDEVRKGVERVVEAAEALRAVRLDTGIEPLSVFNPYREEG